MSDSKPKRVLTETQKEKMKAALEAKRADPQWQAEQAKKRAERKAKKDAEKKKSDDNSSTDKPKRVLSETQKEKMKAALEAKRADPQWQEEQKKKREERKAKKAAAKIEAENE